MTIRAVIALVGLYCVACSPSGNGPDLERMQNQPRYSAFGSSAFFSDGKAMRSPPPGTLSRESEREGAIDSAAVRVLLESRDVIQRGGSRFFIFCAACHGERGDGISRVAENFESPKPPSLVSPPVNAVAPTAVYAVISNGKGRMPSFASELPVRDRWAVVAYLKALDGRTAQWK